MAQRDPAKTDIPALTGVRGFAALWVAAYHLLLPAGFVAGTAAGVLGRGYLAVDLFFVLSGFVMALNYGGLFRGAVALPVFGRFLLRRFARLYPLYGAILVARFVYTALRYGTFDLPVPWIAAPLRAPAVAIPANLLLVQAWGLAGSSIGTAWSISTEWGAYFVFPALAALMLWRGWRWAAGGAVLAAALVLLTAALDAAGGYHAGLLDAWDGLSAGPMLRCLGGFTLGIAVWRLAAWAPAARVAGTGAALAVCVVALAALLLAGAPDLLIYPVFPLLVLCLATGGRAARRVFGNRLAVWLGEISYALYLLHIFLLHPLNITRAAARLALPITVADCVAPAAMCVVLLGASAVCWRLIEQPGRRLILAWAPGRAPSAALGELTPLS